ncbi:MAG: thiamine pyrophosphate-dependent dehydrogenase E1 component subunit alpha [Thermoplasmatales archaeon]|nr:thiamine pyrophosphate-dependent dehydrogenase E1 component subunit alpha [Candidatus Thermoplasmatota archaeon]MCL6003075.1 thiamine pyrophosphate-dependent dehydrogenase E1 component subunit alpha [Candidatus Thermoplasmatota archaeon]MDA8054406.1 thiamine pyrophosphate-dependent dehydrogenase E1 component subunit alpha [Thermoplasmatales archaeon]
MTLVGNLSDDQAILAYKNAVRARTLDLKIISAQRQGIIGFHVPSEGQEMIQIAIGMLADKEDLIFTYYRDLALYLQRGVPISLIFDQMLGNSNDLQKGRQMPDHFSFKEFNFSTVQSPVGAHLPLTVGAAYAMRYNKRKGIVITTFGDGATSTSDFHAALNMASVYNLSVLFVCENNGWAISIPTSKQTRADIYKKGAAYGIPGKRVDGNDLISSLAGLQEAFDYVRSGKGPYLVEASTYRIGPHSTSDDPKKYRVDEITDGSEKDPIRRLENLLLTMGVIDSGFVQSTRAQAKEEIDKTLEERMSITPSNPSTIFDDVYENSSWIQEEERRDSNVAD